MDLLQQIPLFIVIGFLAQVIDGALGMAYGVSATTFLLTFGVSPAVASASVHFAEVVTTAFSGISHLRFGNVDKKLFSKLVIPGVIGAILGSYILTSLPGDALKPWISAYLLVMGIYILIKAFREVVHREVTSHLIPLGLAGGFMDAIGGGGWGPIVVTTLMARGSHPRLTIGSVNLAEFFVALSASITFVLTIGFGFWQPIVGLAVGGAIAAPFAAYITRRIPTRTLMIIVGVLISALSIRTILLAIR
jgi:uncharacterized membrane protein YfcA